ncbi:MAG TPA: type II toxin-antitoxin system RelE/ParE family toxin [Phnomibacter sp.]|nr:type II toxin-antitoxin system RelE/ParE family toxin [Phnomibacter sp.]
MAGYKVLLTRNAEKQLDKIDASQLGPIVIALKQLETDPRPNGYKKLKGRNGYRVRAGNYRIIYEIFDAVLIIEVIAIGHRKDIYR